MATTDIIQRARAHIYGQGIGEAPSIVLAAASANETVSAPTISFSLATGSGSQVTAGNVLSVINAADAASAFVLYVLSMATDTVTALMGYLGSPSPTTADDLDGAVFEIDPLKSESLMWQKMEAIYSTMLWPDVCKYNTYAVTPDLSDYQVELNAAVESIVSAKQSVGGTWIDIPYQVEKNLSTSVSSTGVLGTLYAIDGSSVYLATKERYTAADTVSSALEECIAVGVAAMTLGAARSSTDLEAASKDSQFRGQRNPADSLWRDFITLRSSLVEDLSREEYWFENYR